MVNSRLAEATDLLERGFTSAPTILLSFAVEELGKAAMLQRAYEYGADPVTIEGFLHHQTKVDVGGQFIGTTPRARDRLGNLYVGWEGHWTWNRAPLGREEIRAGIAAVHGPARIISESL